MNHASAVGAALDSDPIDVLVNNAGYALLSTVEETEDDEMLQQFDTNVFGVVRLVGAEAPAMRAQEVQNNCECLIDCRVFARPVRGFVLVQ
jgi:short-subunit dehydrogenase